MLKLTELDEAIRRNLYNPENIFIESWQHLNEANGGNFLPAQSTTPLVGLSELAILMNTITNDELDRLAKSKLAPYAQNIDQLAEHLPLTELPGLQATPSKLQFNLMILHEDLIRNAVKIDATRSRLVVPKETTFTYRERLSFGLLHDIEIIITNNDTVDAYYIENDNPLVNLLNPVINVRTRIKPEETHDVLWVELPIELHQFKQLLDITSITAANGYSKVFKFTDQYYHARVYSNIGNKWVEMNTAVSDFLYNPGDYRATCIVRHADGKVQLTIPEIFFSRNLVGKEIKVELLTTKGLYTDTFQGISVSDWKLVFNNTDSNLVSFVSAMRNVDNVYGYSTEIPTGGKNMPTFEEFRHSVVLGNSKGKAITQDVLAAKLSALGYSTVHDKNYLGESTYLASKAVDGYPGKDVMSIVGANSSDVELKDLAKKAGVVKNGNNFTITPEAMAIYSQSYCQLLTIDEKIALLGKSDLELISTLNEKLYMKSPFYYLVSSDSFNSKVSCFNMDTPSVREVDYKGSNQYLPDRINTVKGNIRRTTEGYVIDIHAAVSSGYKEFRPDSFIPQLTYTTADGEVYSMNGKVTTKTESGDFIFTFLLQTSWDLDTSLGLVISNLTNRSDYDAYYTPLELELNLTYNLVNHLPNEDNETLKKYTDPRKIGVPYVTNTHEIIKLSLGEHLDLMYNPIKSSVGEVEFVTYSADVMAYWPEDVYDKNPDDTYKTVPNPDYDDTIAMDPDTNSPIKYIKLHQKGDPVMNGDVHVVRHAKGSMVYDDVTGAPTPLSRGTMSLRTYMALVDYKFQLVGYMEQIRSNILADINVTLRDVSNDMIELSSLRYSLSNSLSPVSVRYSLDSSGSLPAALSLELSVLVDKVTYEEADTRESIEKLMKGAIASVISKPSFSVNLLIDKIQDVVGDSVAAFKVSSINGNPNLTNWTVTEPDSMLGIKSVLFLNPQSNEMEITDGIHISFSIA